VEIIHSIWAFSKAYLLSDSDNLGADSIMLSNIDYFRPTSQAGSNTANDICRLVGLAVGAEYVRVIEIIRTSPPSSRVLGSWADSGARAFSEDFDFAQSSRLERTSIDSGTCVTELAPIDLVEPDEAEIESSDSWSSGFAVPVANESGVLGAIGVYFDHDRSHDVDTSVVESLSDMLAGAMQATRRVEQLSSESTIWNSLAEISQLVDLSVEDKDTHRRLAATVESLLDFDVLTISLVDSEEGTHRLEFATGEPSPTAFSPASESLEDSYDDMVLRSKKGLRVGSKNIGSISARHQDAENLITAGFRSWLTVPLIWKDSEVGLLSVLSKRTDAFTDEHLKILDQVGKCISGAFAYSKMYEKQRLEIEVESMITAIDRAIASASGISEVYSLFTEQLERWIPFDRLSIGESNPKTGIVQRKFVYGLDIPGLHTGHNNPLGAIFELSMRSGQGAIRTAGEIYREESASAWEDAGHKVGLLSILAVALTVQGRIVGTLGLRANNPHAFNNRHRLLAELAADRIATSMLAFQYQSVIDEHVGESQILDDFFTDVVVANSTDAIMDRTFEVVTEILQVDRIVLGLIAPGATPRLQLHTRGMIVPGGDVAGRLAFTAQNADGWVRDGNLQPHYGQTADVPNLVAGHGLRLTDAGLHSWMHSPLTTNQLQGYIAVQGRPRAGYLQRHIAKLDKIAYLLARVFETLKLSEPDLRSSEDESGPVSDVGRDLPASTSAIDSYAPIKLLLIDGDPLYLAGLSTILGSSNINVVGVTSSSEALAEITAIMPDVVLVYARNDESGLQEVRHLIDDDSMPPLLVIIEDIHSDESRRYLEAGVSAVISTRASAYQIISAIDQAAKGHSESTPYVLELFAGGEHQQVSLVNSDQHKNMLKITDRDRKILKGLASGQSNSEIARDLSLATGTVSNRLGELYILLDVPDRSAAVYESMRLGLIT